jgi:hypothetical protein
VRPSNSEGDVKLELTAQPSPSSEPAKITFEFAAKNVDTKQYSFDGQSKLAYYSPNGKDAAILISAKNIPQREQRVVEAQVRMNITGAIIRKQNKITSHFKDVYKDEVKLFKRHLTLASTRGNVVSLWYSL